MDKQTKKYLETRLKELKDEFEEVRSLLYPEVKMVGENWEPTTDGFDIEDFKEIKAKELEAVEKDEWKDWQEFHLNTWALGFEPIDYYLIALNEDIEDLREFCEYTTDVEKVIKVKEHLNKLLEERSSILLLLSVWRNKPTQISVRNGQIAM